LCEETSLNSRIDKRIAMAKKKKKLDYKEFSTEEIQERIVEESGKLQQLHFTHVISPLENPIQIRDARRNIARLKTELQRRLNTQA